MKLAALAMCLVSAVASAQTLTCTDAAPGAPRLPFPPASIKPACLPTPLGIVIESNSVGAAAAWWCPGLTQGAWSTPPALYLYAVRWSAVKPEMMADVLRLFEGGASQQAVQATTAKYQTQSVMEMCDVWGPAWARILASKPK